MGRVKLIYIETTVIYILIFTFVSFIYYKSLIFKKLKNKINILEEKLIWKIPDYFKLIFPIIPNFTLKILRKYKKKLIESQLVEILNELIPLAEGGISCFDTLENICPELKEPIRNEIKFLLLRSKEYG